jgi:SNF2 family DNA or RNA helicase
LDAIAKQKTVSDSGALGGILCESYPKKGFEIKSSADYEPAQTGILIRFNIFKAAGFGLKLHEYQARTLSWLYQVESSAERVLSFTCRESEDESAEQSEVPDWIRLDLNGNIIFYSLSESVFFEYSPSKPRTGRFIKYRVPVNGVALCDNPGSGKTIVSLALIHSKPFLSVDHLGFDVTSFVPSRATLIICPLHLATQWQEEALRCMPDAKVEMIQVYIHHPN